MRYALHQLTGCCYCVSPDQWVLSTARMKRIAAAQVVKMYGQEQPKKMQDIAGMDDVVQELKQKQSEFAFKRAAGKWPPVCHSSSCWTGSPGCAGKGFNATLCCQRAGVHTFMLASSSVLCSHRTKRISSAIPFQHALYAAWASICMLAGRRCHASAAAMQLV